MIHRFVFALSLFACAPSFAADVPAAVNRYAATMAPSERFDVGATLVEKHGQNGTPVILIPGLASGGWVWQETARQLMKQHVVYVLTLPGFDGRPAVAGKGMAAAQDTVRELIETRKLKRPAVIGHSLGGMMAMALAAQYPDLVGGAVSIDGVPVFPGTEEWPAEQRKAMGGAIAGRMQAPNQAVFVAQQQQYMRGMGVTDMGRADELAKLTGKSDPAAVTQYMIDALALDLRGQLPAIKAPVLVIAPYFEADSAQMQMTQENKTEYYRKLMQGTPNVKVV
jgi:pimeloyl-ACP methyl ester carboxylesterase